MLDRQGRGVGESGGLSRRAVVRGGALGLGGMLAAACGGPNAGQSGTSQKPAAPIEIEYWSTNTAGDTPEGKARYGVLELFQQKNPDFIKLSHGQSATSNALDKVKTAMAAGSPPNMGVFHQYWGSDLHTLGGLADVEDLLKGEKDWAKTKGEIYPQLITANSWKGKLFGVPVSNSYFGMFFHRGRLKAEGLADPKPGWTFDEMMTMMRKAAKPPDVWGFTTAWQTAYQRMWAGSNGATFLNKDGTKVVLTSPENVESVQFELDMLKAGLMRPASDGNFMELLPTGGQVFQMAIPQRISLYHQQNVDFGTVTYPIGPKNTAKKPYTIGSTYSFCIFKNKDKEKERISALAAKFAAQKDGQMFVARTAVVPVPNRVVSESAEFKAEFGKDPAYWPIIEMQPYFDPYPNFPKFQDAYNALSAELGKVWRGEQTPKDAMAEAERLSQIALDASLKL
jgi:multiple sugar transport system substrate-binding protein